MDQVYADLASKIYDVALSKAPRRTLVGIAGPPGCGKTTIAAQVIRLLNRMLDSTVAIAIAMDGFHYTRAQLDAFPDPAEAHRRRGAPWTFDADAVLSFIQRLRETAKMPAEERPVILAPSFDHAIKDPVADDIAIPAEASIVILEGNYLLLDDEGWREIGPLLDYRVLVQVDSLEARRRVAKRHVLAGIEPTIELGEQRFDSNDGINGDLIRRGVVSCDAVVDSFAA